MVCSGDFNVIRRTSKKLGVSRSTPSMRCFNEFIRECELTNPLLQNATFTWSNMQASPICKRLDKFLFSNEWDHFFPQSLQEAFPRWTSNHIVQLAWIQTLSSGARLFSDLRICGCSTMILRTFLDVGGRSFKLLVGMVIRFMMKLKFIKSKWKEWNRESFGVLKEKKNDILSNIERIDLIEQEGDLSLDLSTLRAMRKRDLENLLLKEEVH